MKLDIRHGTFIVTQIKVILRGRCNRHKLHLTIQRNRSEDTIHHGAKYIATLILYTRRSANPKKQKWKPTVHKSPLAEIKTNDRRAMFNELRMAVVKHRDPNVRKVVNRLNGVEEEDPVKIRQIIKAMELAFMYGNKAPKKITKKP